MKVLEHYINEAFTRRYLLEGIEDVKKYYADIDDDKFMQIITLDPTYKEGVDKVGTYGKWLLNIYRKHNLKDEDFYKVNDYLKEFEEKRRWFKNKDIQQFKSLSDLAKALNEVEVGELTDNQKDKQFKKELKNAELDAKKVFEDSEFEVWIPNDYTASCKLASNTEWCTGPSSKGDTRYYDMYTKQGPLYIVLSKQDKDEKYQFHFESNQFMNRYDESIDFWGFMDEHPSLSDYFTPIAVEFYCPEIKNLKDDEEVTIDCMLEDLLYSYGQRWTSRDALDKSTIEDILCNNGEDTFDVYNWEISNNELTDALEYNKKEILQDGVISEFLNEHNLSFEDLTLAIIRDADNELDESIADAVGRAYTSAIQSGTINQAFNDVKGDIIDAFESIEGLKPSKVEFEVLDNSIDSTIHFTCQSNDLKEYLLDRVKEYNDEVTSSVEICRDAADELSCYEPRYGWNNFDSDFFVYCLAEDLASI